MMHLQAMTGALGPLAESDHSEEPHIDEASTPPDGGEKCALLRDDTPKMKEAEEKVSSLRCQDLRLELQLPLDQNTTKDSARMRWTPAHSARRYSSGLLKSSLAAPPMLFAPDLSYWRKVSADGCCEPDGQAIWAHASDGILSQTKSCDVFCARGMHMQLPCIGTSNIKITILDGHFEMPEDVMIRGYYSKRIAQEYHGPSISKIAQKDTAPIRTAGEGRTQTSGRPLRKVLTNKK